MKIVVTGAAGFIGSHAAERFAGMGHEVVGIDCFTDYYDVALKRLNAADVASRGVRLHRLDLAVDDLTAVLANTDFIFHLAAQPGISVTTPFADYVRNNLVATQRLLEAAKGVSSLQCFVTISTSSVYGKRATDTEEMPPQPTSYYGVTKLAAEQLTLAYFREQGMPTCALRIFSVFGPRERPEKLFPRLIGSILQDEPFPLYQGSKSHSRSFTFVGDIVDGFTAVLHQPQNAVGEIFNLGSDVEFTTGEGIEIVERILGKQAQMKIVPKRPGDQLRTCANIEKAGRLLGYEPKTRLEDGLAAEVAWFQERVYGKG